MELFCCRPQLRQTCGVLERKTAFLLGFAPSEASQRAAPSTLLFQLPTTSKLRDHRSRIPHGLLFQLLAKILFFAHIKLLGLRF